MENACPHMLMTIKINFFDTGKETKNQQSWSIDNIKTFRIALRKNVYIHTHILFRFPNGILFATRVARGTCLINERTLKSN